MQNLYKHLHNLKQVGSVDEYNEAFHQLVARVELNEKAYNRALVAEKQEKRKFTKSGQQYQRGSMSGQPFYSYSRGGSSSTGGQGASSEVGTQNRADKASIPAQNQPQSSVSGTRNQSQSGGFKCFKCGEPGHKSSDCCKAYGGRNMALFIEEVMEQGCEDDIPVYDKDMCEEIGGEGDYKASSHYVLASKGFLKESHETGHKPGILNKVVNGLSRRVALLVEMKNKVVGFEEFRTFYAEDPYFSKIVDALQRGDKVTHPCFMLKDVFLFKGLKLCVPACSLREQLLAESHKLGHFGKGKTLGMLQDAYYWLGMAKDVGGYVQRCQTCQQGKGTATNAGLYLPLPVPDMISIP
ncbi:hypothetical protein RHGRI_014614 [Rhododendron griersonianum]|uniref:CCHC-type domain-containing protein n=1 Tax=Rhododendron griersonianum TaxID=479676 RepID=A0AAV6KAG7_9ERIC|nr:hypothetical protein RHGRI_014614 [Rhododendron griersonianum]